MRRMTKAGYGLVAALEAEEELVAEVAAEKAEEIGDNAESLETDMLEVNEESSEADAEEAEVDNAAEVVEALESMRDLMGIAAQNGGMDKHSAAVVAVALEHMYASVGMRARVMPALESFGGTSSRVGATQLAMEGIGEGIAKIWAAIMAAIRKAIAWVEEFFVKVFKIAEKLNERAKGMAAKITATKGSAKGTIENERLVAALQVAGVVDAGKNIANFEAGTIGILEGTTSRMKESETKLADFAKPDFFKSVLVDYTELPTSGKNFTAIANPESAGFAAVPAGLSMVRTDELFGGMGGVFIYPTTELKGKAAIAVIDSIGGSLTKINPKAAAITKKDVPVLSLADATKVAEAVVTTTDALLKFKAQAKAISEMKKKFVKAADELGKKAEKATDEQKEGVSASQKIIRAWPKALDSVSNATAKYILSTDKALLDYIELSLKQYAGTESAAAEPAAKPAEPSKSTAVAV